MAPIATTSARPSSVRHFAMKERVVVPLVVAMFIAAVAMLVDPLVHGDGESSPRSLRSQLDLPESSGCTQIPEDLRPPVAFETGTSRATLDGTLQARPQHWGRHVRREPSSAPSTSPKVAVEKVSSLHAFVGVVFAAASLVGFAKQAKDMALMLRERLAEINGSDAVPVPLWPRAHFGNSRAEIAIGASREHACHGP
eukprot:CAMPEP_0176247552 /NCGR_PEP_ID=MMETSP0121_2-20121125/33014_1 /TAXON_ID=160619 /ORGANISM="Kryptoperidinium foliaceum, Strain CCMP 1326" /LENGTH=196 /DNA_ID=CAMNT_0017587211 /DNA_START=114 /DNA_END=701 /DNA_ORIENTATION=-